MKEHEHQEQAESSESHAHGNHGRMEGTHHEGMEGGHEEMTRKMREKWLWTNYTVITLGVWLMTSPFTFGSGRAALTWSDVLSGLLLVVFGAMAINPKWDFIGRWGAAFVGLWLNFAPLVFWAPMPVTFVTDTLIGSLVIALTILIPMMPGMAHHMEMMKPGPEIPPGWSYNPSSWTQRAPLIITAVLGWFISRYLAAVQLGYIDRAWEPFFGEGTQRVLHSEVSQSWPISDAGFGAFAYTIEALMAWMGGTTRWRTMPWMVTFFGILVIPLGLTHIILVILQPVAVGYWCTLCLAAAFVMLLMIPLTVDEVVAMFQFMARSVREGKPFWRTFWVGGTFEDEPNEDNRSPHYGDPPARFGPAMIWGVTFPWNLVLSTLLALWVIFSPLALGTGGALMTSTQVMGCLLVTFSIIAMAEPIRLGRFANVIPALWLMLAPWILEGASASARVHDLLVGAAFIALSIPRGRIREHFGAWDRFVR